MKYQQGKIKKEHNILEDFRNLLKEIEKLEDINRIIPGRISRKQKGSSHRIISFSYYTQAGMKYNMNKGGTSQELFIVCNENDKENVYNKIRDISINLKFTIK